MTRKDFEIVAQIVAAYCYIAENHLEYPSDFVDTRVNRLLKQSNPNYNAERFWNAVNKHVEKLENDA